MPWQDDQIIEPAQNAQPAWMADPIVEQQPAPQADNRSFLDRMAPQPSQRPVGDLGSVIMEPLAVLGTSAVAAPVAGLAGIGAAGTRALGLTQAEPADVVRGVQGALTYQPRTGAGEVAAEYNPIALLGKGIGFLGEQAGDFTARTTGSPAAGAAVNTATQFAPALLIPGLKGRAKPAEVAPNVGRTAPVDRPVAAGEAPSPPAAAVPAKPSPRLAKVPDSAPTLEKLRADKNAAYKRSEEAGVQISEFSFKKLKGKILNELGERVDPTLHPDTTAALKRVMDTKGAISLEKLDQLRQIANDAKGAVKPADQRLAAKVVDSIDEYLDGLSPKDITRGDPKGAAALVEARALNTRLKKGEQIEELFRRAEIRAGANYTQSGLENALRQEFKALALNEKKMKRFTPEERAAITKVAKGGKLENALRFMGKFAPTGVISATLSGGLGAMLAGPAGAALPLTGLASRAAATRMTLRNAQSASELMRRGPRNALAEEPAPKRNALLEY
jgi:hypothetical protein